jgi:PAS domain S-box-containing protein
LRYQFKIEGVDRDWSAPTVHRSVNLTLAPGSYRFLVRAVGAGGTVSPSPASVQFRILPPVWRRWWFITVGGLLVASAVLAFARQRAARLKALRDSENRFRALAETASDAIFVIDDQGSVVFANRAAENIFGYSTDEMMQQEISRFIPGYRRFLRQAGFGGEAMMDISWDARECQGVHQNGREVPLELSFSEFTRKDKLYITIIARDVTERKRAEEALRKSREERLAELEQVRRRIAADLHDDIGSSLSQISLLSEVARRGAADTPQVSEPLSLISAASHEVLNSMSDIVWAINPHRDHLSDLLHRIRRFTGETLNASNIPFKFSGSDLNHDLRLGANVRREVFLIFKETINNIVRHSGCTESVIKFGVEDDCLNLTVSDNGKGFDVARGGDGHGLTSMRARAAGIGARFDVVSAPGKGTTLTLIVPLQH